MFKCGVVSVSFRQLSVDEVIRYTKEAGLDQIEWGSDVHAPYNDPERIAYIAKAQAEAGISCPSYGTYFKLGVDDTELLHGYASAARALGTDILRLWCGNKNYTICNGSCDFGYYGYSFNNANIFCGDLDCGCVSGSYKRNARPS